MPSAPAGRPRIVAAREPSPALPTDDFSISMRGEKDRAVDFGRRRPIEGESTIGGRLREIGGRLREIGDWRKREEKEEEKKQNLYCRRLQVARASSHVPRRCTWVARALSPPTGRPCTVAARTHERFFSRTRRRNVSPRKEKDQRD
ncbi:hypothetical protein BHE74_00051432, partial [Ensete ventricosum]